MGQAAGLWRLWLHRQELHLTPGRLGHMPGLHHPRTSAARGSDGNPQPWRATGQRADRGTLARTRSMGRPARETGRRRSNERHRTWTALRERRHPNSTQVRPEYGGRRLPAVRFNRSRLGRGKHPVQRISCRRSSGRRVSHRPEIHLAPGHRIGTHGHWQRTSRPAGRRICRRHR